MRKFQVVILFEGTGLGNHSQSNVGRLNRVLVNDDSQVVRFFVGCHTDIGGGYREHTLADIAGEWIARGGIRQGLRIRKDVVWSKQELSDNPIIHNSLKEVSNLWGVVNSIRRKIDIKRLHKSAKKLYKRILLDDGIPVPPESFASSPST